MKLPILYHKAKGGDLRQWTVWADDDTIYTEYGQVDGKLQVSSKKAEAKNVGRSNETSPSEQARLEAESMWRFKVERKYSETPEAAQEELMLPMLAHKYEDKKKHVTYPAFVQPKLDGVRCIAKWEDKSVILLSRSGKPYKMPLIQADLMGWMPKDVILDGELYLHGASCQTITSLVKKWKPESNQVIFNVYDAPVVNGEDSLNFDERLQYLRDIEDSTPPTIAIVPTLSADSHKELMEYHGFFLEKGYEGAILRLPHGLYQWGYRSSELLKVKEFQDAEFRVLSARDGKGKMEGGVIWTCVVNGHNTFECTMKVTMEERPRMYKNRDKYIGRDLTVRFFDRTDDGIPRFPVGIVFRDEKDL